MEDPGSNPLDSPNRDRSSKEFSEKSGGEVFWLGVIFLFCMYSRFQPDCVCRSVARAGLGLGWGWGSGFRVLI